MRRGRLGIGFGFAGGVVVPEAETDAWEAAVVSDGGTVSAGRKTLVNNLIVGLKADGVFAKLDRLWLDVAENSQSALRDLVGANLASLNGAPTFTADAGYSFASAQFINSGFNASTAGGHYARNSACLFVWSNTSGSKLDPAAGNTLNSFIYPRQTSTSFFGVQDDGSFGTSVANGDGSGLFAADRADSATQKGYKNGSQVVSTSNTSTALGNANLLFGDVSGAGGWIGVLFVRGFGASLTAGNHTSLYSRLHTYLQATAGIP